MDGWMDDYRTVVHQGRKSFSYKQEQALARTWCFKAAPTRIVDLKYTRYLTTAVNQINPKVHSSTLAGDWL